MPSMEGEVQRRLAEAFDRIALGILSGSAIPKPAPTFSPIYGLRGHGSCTACDAIIHRSTPCDRSGCPKAPKPHPGRIFAVNIS